MEIDVKYRLLAFVLLSLKISAAEGTSCLPIRRPGETVEAANLRFEQDIRHIVQEPAVAKLWKDQGVNVVTGVLSRPSRISYALAKSTQSILEAFLEFIFGPRSHYFVIKGERTTFIVVDDYGWNTDCYFEDRKMALRDGHRYAFLTEYISGDQSSSYRIAVATDTAYLGK